VEATETLDNPTKFGGNPWEKKEVSVERKRGSTGIGKWGGEGAIYIMEEREKGRYQEPRN